MNATRKRPFLAVVADMDGVLTRTADLHERAWKKMFDEFLGARGDQAPFSGDDYRAHVDGKPRYDGVSDFLGSRGIQLPEGEAEDGPDRETVRGLGNRKNRLFLELLEREGVTVFDDVVPALERWRRGGLRLAVISSSRNCRRVLRAGNLEDRFDAVVDGQTASELGLEGKPDILLEAARRLDVDPSDAVVLEDARAGVSAGRRQGFGRVVGISRDGQDEGLLQAGADEVARNVYEVRFLRRVPDLLERLDQLRARRRGRPWAVFLDFDGTLSPIVDDPDDAFMPDPLRRAVRELAQTCPVAVVSGRDRTDVTTRVGLEGLAYAGNHGVDIVAGDQHKTLPRVEEAMPDVARAEQQLRRRLDRLPGALIERKRYSVAAHYRKVQSEDVLAQVEDVVQSVANETGLRLRYGEKVFELEPAVDWHKGRALDWLVETLPRVDPNESFIVYVGDGETDEDAFAALRGRGAGVHVGDPVTTTLADYRVADPDGVLKLLQWMARES